MRGETEIRDERGGERDYGTERQEQIIGERDKEEKRSKGEKRGRGPAGEIEDSRTTFSINCFIYWKNQGLCRLQEKHEFLHQEPPRRQALNEK